MKVKSGTRTQVDITRHYKLTSVRQELCHVCASRQPPIYRRALRLLRITAVRRCGDWCKMASAWCMPDGSRHTSEHSHGNVSNRINTDRPMAVVTNGATRPAANCAALNTPLALTVA